MTDDGTYEVQVEGVAFRGHHGVYEEERAEGRAFEVDLSVEVRRRAPPGTDDLAATLDYRRLSAIVLEVGEGEPVQLVETLADRIAARCLELPEVEAADVTVRKRATGVPGDPRWVGVRVRRRG